MLRESNSSGIASIKMKAQQVQVSTIVIDGSGGYGSFGDRNSDRGGYDGSSEDESGWSFLFW